MAMILTFQTKKAKAVQSNRQRPNQGQVIIFPGVRYERLPEPSYAAAKLNKKARKSA